MHGALHLRTSTKDSRAPFTQIGRMKNRRTFLAAAATSGVGLAFGARGAEAQSARATVEPASTPTPSASPRPISAEAMAIALTFRAFDPALSDSEIETIARGVDNKRGAGSRLNPKGALLKNADEPITRFTVPSHEAK